MGERLALLDWDGTLRRGWTLPNWVAFLASSGVVPAHAHGDVQRHLDEYGAGSISHDLLVARSNGLYASLLAGVPPQTVLGLIPAFVEPDQDSLFRFVPGFVKLLLERKIRPVVITGAPEEIVKRHANSLGIQACFGLRLGVEAGVYTGFIASNPGLSEAKQAHVASLIGEGHEIVLAVGDSASDTPLFEAAPSVIVVGGDLRLVPPGRRGLEIRPSEPTDSILCRVASLLPEPSPG